MPIESDADRAIFTNADEFGALAIYTPAGEAASDPFTGQFDDPSRSASIGSIGALDTTPTFYCQAASVPSSANGDAGDVLAIGGDTFLVTALEPDGTGMVLLRLGAMDPAP
jgi:hypothetical protein